jgi:type I restriction enzyme S subunit
MVVQTNDKSGTMIQNNNIPQGYKDSPLGIIPEGWGVKRLGEIFELSSGKTKPKDSSNEYYDDYIFPIYGGNGILGYAKKFSHSLPQIIIGRVGEYCGQVLCVKNNCWVTDNALFTKYIDECDIDFLTYKLQFENLSKLRSKGGQPLISQKPIYLHSISLPPLSEQQKIAEILTVWDNAIDIQMRFIASLQKRKQGLMQQLLTGKKRLKGFEGEWKEVKLGEIFDERNELNFNCLPLLSVGQSGIYPQTESDKKDISNDDKSKYKRICKGDIGYNTMRMWQGRSALSKLEGIISPAYTVIIPKADTDSLYFSYLFKTSKIINLFWRNSQGLVDDTLNCKFKDFSKIKIRIPPIEEQTAIANILFAADKEINLAKKKLTALKEQKKGLMQQLLTGKKRVETPKLGVSTGFRGSGVQTKIITP